jgi:hypothetical protein
MALVASCIAGIPFSITAHRADIAENNLHYTKAEYAMLLRFISKSGLRMACELIPNFPVNKTTNIHIGVEIPDHITLKKHDKDSIPIIFCPASLIPVK